VNGDRFELHGLLLRVKQKKFYELSIRSTPKRLLFRPAILLDHQLKKDITMRYILLIYDNEAEFSAAPEKQIAEVMEEYGRFTAALKGSGAYVSSGRLRHSTSATSVRIRRGQTLLTDGPFAETKEQLGGYYLIEVKDLDEAVQWAAKVPSAKFGSIEVRPLWE
jgi:hypothetical protein